MAIKTLKIGTKVLFDCDGNTGEGITRRHEHNIYEIEVTKHIRGCKGYHSCGDLLSNSNGWNVPSDRIIKILYQKIFYKGDYYV